MNRISYDTFQQLVTTHVGYLYGMDDYGFYITEHESFMKLCRTRKTWESLGLAIIQEEKIQSLQEALDL